MTTPHAAPAPVADALVGRVLGEFLVKEKVAEGGFGAVFRAEQKGLGREAVVKVLLGEQAKNRVGVQRFLREAQLASQLDHPYAAHTYAFGVEPDGVFWIAMEFVRGTTLEQLLSSQGPLPLARAVPLLERICEVVQAAHEIGIIHRDIKPSNIMVMSRAGRLSPKLLDLGIAKVRSGAEGASDDAERLSVLDGKLPFNFPFSVSDLADSSPANLDDTTRTSNPRQDLTPRVTLQPEEILSASQQLGALGFAPVSLATLSSRELHLTRGGDILGSPHYMSPEQWVGAADIDGRADVYALGVVTFQCLTGRRPFHGHSVRELARAHVSETPDSLGEVFPAALDAVIKKALAKAASDRYPTPNELAAALRAAAGLSTELGELPHLATELREDLLAAAPQPLAEAVAVLEAARTPRQAREATRGVASVAARLLGILALASRVRVGPGESKDSAKTRELLARLRSETLSAPDWLQLAAELAQPFAARRDVHPIPELVAFFFGEEGEPTGHAQGLASLTEPALAVDDEQAAMSALFAELKQLEPLLSSVEFLASYVTAVRRGEQVERWMGARRARRTLLGIEVGAAQDGEVGLFSEDGTEVLALHPLVQVLPPAPASTEEMFLLEGNGRHGAKLVAYPLGFERNDEALWAWFRQNFPELEEDAQRILQQEFVPFRGLSSFTSADADLYFGREQESEAVANRLRVTSFLAVVGPSGVGKSSFIHAGVLPRLDASWKSFTVRPGPSPVAALAAGLARLGIEVPNLRAELERDLNALGELLGRAARAAGQHLMLVVDQFEELLTLCHDPEERHLYAEALSAAAGSADAPVRIVLTLRDDFLIRVQQLPAFRERLAASLQLLATPVRDQLLRILQEPVRRAGYEFEEHLAKQMVDAVADQSTGALALLSFSASKLWELRDRQLKRLTRRAYETLGGVGGALAHHAEALLEGMSEEEVRLVREAFRHLVSAEGTRAILSREEMEQVLGGSAAAAQVLEKLVNARLLVTSEGAAGETRVEVIHEALLSSWPRLVKWQREEAESVRLRDELRAAVRQWEAKGRPRALLWRGELIAEYRRWRTRYQGALTQPEEAFVQASLREEAQGRRLRRGLMTTAFVVLSVGLLILVRANNRANAAVVAAKARLIDGYVEQGRAALESEKNWVSLVYLTAARELAPDSPVLQLMRGFAATPARLERSRFPSDGPTWYARFSPDGRYVASAAESGASVWDARDGHLLGALRGHTGDVRLLDFAPDGLLATCGADALIHFYRLPSLEPVATLKGHQGPVHFVSFSPDGQLLLSGGQDGTARIWSRQGKQLVQFAIPPFNFFQGFETMAAWNKDQSLVAIAGSDDSAGIFEPGTGKRVQRIQALVHLPTNTGVNSVRFDPTGKRLVTTGDDGFARVWEPRSGKMLLELPGAGGALQYATFTPDGQQVVAAGNDGVVHVWDAHSGKALRHLHGQRGTIWQFDIDAEGRNLITASDDGSSRLWDLGTGEQRAVLEGNRQPVMRTTFSPDGKSALNESLEGTTLLWTVGDAVEHVTHPAPGGELRDTSWTRDGDRVLVMSEKATVLWSALRAAPLATLGPVSHGALEPGGKWWVTSLGTQLTLHRDGGRTDVIDTGITVSVVAAQGERVLVGAADGHVQLWDVVAHEKLSAYRTSSGLSFLSFTADGFIVTASDDGQVLVNNARDGGAVRSMMGPKKPWFWALSPDGARLGVIARGASEGAVLDLRGVRKMAALKGSHGYLASMAFDVEGRRLVTIDAGGTFRVWDRDTGNELQRMTGDRQQALQDTAFDRTGQLVYLLDQTSSITAWDVASQRMVGAVRRATATYYPIPEVEVPKVKFDNIRVLADGRVATVTTYGEVVVWSLPHDTQSPAELRRMLSCKSPVALGAAGQILPVTPTCP